jgi:hypothetical protein
LHASPTDGSVVEVVVEVVVEAASVVLVVDVVVEAMTVTVVDGMHISGFKPTAALRAAKASVAVIMQPSTQRSRQKSCAPTGVEKTKSTESVAIRRRMENSFEPWVAESFSFPAWRLSHHSGSAINAPSVNIVKFPLSEIRKTAAAARYGVWRGRGSIRGGSNVGGRPLPRLIRYEPAVTLSQFPPNEDLDSLYSAHRHLIFC